MIRPSIFIFIITILPSCGSIKEKQGFTVNTEGLEKSILHVPTRVVTQGPKYHSFSYYDKLQFDPTGRYMLGMEFDFEMRQPKIDDTIRIGMVDLYDNDKWIELGTSSAWCWQQGCMLQFIPGSDSLIIWNDREGDHFISRIKNIYTNKERELAFSIACLSPDGKAALTTDFERLDHLYPGYGYVAPYPDLDVLHPENSGIYRCDLITGEKNLIISYKQMVDMVPTTVNVDRRIRKGWFDITIFNPGGNRFLFLHRCTEAWGYGTLLCTADLNGENINIVDSSNSVSHLIWRDSEHIAAWRGFQPYGNSVPYNGSAFFLFTDGKPDETRVISKEHMVVNGHITYLPGNQWILNDTYRYKNGFQHVYLYNVITEVVVPLGDFYAPKEYKGVLRCDTHPRFSPDGTKVCIDCPTSNSGRQLVLMDVSDIVNGIGKYSNSIDN